MTDTEVAWRAAFAHLMDMEESEVETMPMRRWNKRMIFAFMFLLLVILLLFAWSQRIAIADDFVRDYLNKRNIRATYQIDDIGFRYQRISNVVIGDPARPDFIARQVELDVAIGFGAPALRSVKASGLRIFARYADGKVSFGELDKFLDPDSKEPFRLPDIHFALKDARLSLATPWGGVGAALAGSGHIANGFAGNLAISAPKLTNAECSAEFAKFSGTIHTRNSQPELEGPLTAATISCPTRGLALAGAAIKGKVKLSQKLDNWVGDLGFAARTMRASGQQLNSAEGKVNFYGNRARTDFELALAKAAYRAPDLAIAKLSGDTAGRLSLDNKGLSLSAKGSASFFDAAYSGAALAGLGGIAKGTQGTPVGPLLAALDPALRKALRAFDGSFDFDTSIDREKASVVMASGLKLRSKSGAQINQLGGLTLADGGLNGSVQLSVSGGGLPNANLALRPRSRGWTGTLALAPFAQGGASLSLPKLDFAGGPGGLWRFNGQALLTGPLMGGRIEGLSMAVDGSITGSHFAMLSGCKDIRFTRFQTGSLNLPGQAFRACAERGSILTVGGGETRLVFRSPVIAARGSLGSTPLAFNSGNIRFDLDSGFAASNVSVDLGTPDALTQFAMANLDARFGGAGIIGTLEGGAGKIGNVPLLIAEANGNWGWNSSILTLDGMAQISDAEQVDRFETLSVPSMQIALENNVITALGQLKEPTTGTHIADVDIRHELNSSTGRALLAVDGLAFNEKFQPELLTALTLGAIANVEGSIAGDGVIEWDRDSVRSRGKFATSALSFAAAFGPVTGLATEVTFTDLLGLETAPSQVARLAEVNPGIPAFDGKLEYRLLADQKVQIEEGRWPFYGGELILEPTIIDFDVQKKRELTFRLVGLDAEKFLAGYELENIRVAGVFDGTLPMVFDAEGGRIVGGWLVSRPGGGEVSYLGPLAYEDMGAMANFAFEALRSIAFDEMQIGVNGNIGGEVVTEVRFRGLQQGTGAKRNFITKQLAKLPIQFNVRIQSEFISLFGDMRLLFDGEYAAQRLKSELIPPPIVTGEEQ